MSKINSNKIIILFWDYHTASFMRGTRVRLLRRRPDRHIGVIRPRCETVEKLRQSFHGDPIPLDTEPVPVETGSDTPGFAPDGAGRGQNPRHMSLDFENFKSLCSNKKQRKTFFYKLTSGSYDPDVFFYLLDSIPYAHLFLKCWVCAKNALTI